MSVRSAQVITKSFTTQTSTGAATNADSLPTGTLVVNGTDNGASVTVTNKAAGDYKAAVTLPTLAIGDAVEIRITATVGGVIGKAIIWGDVCDLALTNVGTVAADAIKFNGVDAGEFISGSGASPGFFARTTDDEAIATASSVGDVASVVSSIGDTVGTINANTTPLATMIVSNKFTAVATSNTTLAVAQSFNNTGQSEPLPADVEKWKGLPPANLT